MLDLLPLEPRREPKKLGRFHRGTHKPLAIRWFGMTAMAGNLRHLLAVAAASNQLDLRDWMGPEEAAGLLNRACKVLGASASGGNVTERLGREVWIDFVADTGDDHDGRIDLLLERATRAARTGRIALAVDASGLI